MSSAAPGAIRRAAVAGSFYPADERELAFQVDKMLTDARATTPDDADVPKAIIAPHAGYIYSGGVAASIYARLGAAREIIKRVVIVGPAHRVYVTGAAVPTVAGFATPLGVVPLDQMRMKALLQLPFVEANDDAHGLEHSLETQLPFLQQVLDEFVLTPIVAGGASDKQIAQMLNQVWGGPETLIVISSDLSHYHDYDTARRLDGETCAAVETLDPARIVPERACGARGVNGLLHLARRRDLRATTIELKNSGDTAGPRDRVVGYGAWSFADNAASRISAERRKELLEAAARSIRNGLANGRRPKVRIETFAREIRCVRGSFVTLNKAGKLRGCIGSISAHRPLIADVVWNAYSAAFDDPRFGKLQRDEFKDLELSISILGVPGPFPVSGEEELLAKVRPNVDGLILQDGKRRGLFLPQVWEQLPEPRQFLAHLKVKAGIKPDEWPETLQVFRFSSECFKSDIESLDI